MNLHARKLERNREEVRKLSLKDGSRFCMDCGLRGPMYVVTNFGIFVCSTCAALHRSLQHKVKGISMTEFTDEEVIKLRNAGNDRAARIWLHSYRGGRPPSGNEAAIRDFIINVFDAMVYMDRGEFDRFQNELLKAMSTDSGSLQERVTLQSLQVAETQTQKPSESRTLESQDVPSVQDSPIDFFTQPAPPHASENTTLNTSNSNANDDLFGDFCTAAAPPTASAYTAPSAHDMVADLFASAPPVPLQSNVMYQAAPGITGMYAMQSTPQVFPPGVDQYRAMMPTQPGMQNFVGMNQAGFDFVRGTAYPNPSPQQQQQQQYPCQERFVHSVGASTAPVVFNNVPGAHAQQSLVGGVSLLGTNNTNFFQATPTGSWGNTTAATPPMKTVIKGQQGEEDSNVFISLNPFGSNR